MLVEFDFRLTQARYLKAAVQNIATYSPDGLNEAAIGTLITNATTVRQAYIDAKETFDLGRAEFREKINQGHDTAVGVYPAMKSRFRNDASSLEAINGLPTQDQTADQTIKRMEQMSSLWAKLPHIGTPAAEFVAWTGMSKTEFDAILTSAKALQAALPDKDQAFQLAEGNLHETFDGLVDFITAALQQGRAQFKRGTEREVIDAVPNEPAQQPPGQAAISEATGGQGTVHLLFDAPHATSFDVFRKEPEAEEFTKVADDTIEQSYDASDVAPGNYDFKVVGRNSLGTGPESQVKTVTVT